MFYSNGRRASSMAKMIFVAAVLTFITTSAAHAQQAKVVKVQGKKAIVQFPDEARPRVGQVIDLGGGTSISGEPLSHSSSGARNMIIGGSTELSSLTAPGSATSQMIFTADARYGWNKSEMEYGGIGTIGYVSSTGVTKRKLEAGGFFDYNLVHNNPGVELVYGGMAVAKFGQIANVIGSAETSGTLMTLEVGGQMKWFPLGNTVAIRGDVLYRIESVADSVKAYTTGPGLVAKGGLYVYF